MLHAYALLLIVSGVAILAMGLAAPDKARWRRTLNFLFSGVYSVYGLYLMLFFHGGHYLIFFYAFLVPIVLALSFFRDRRRAGSQPAARRHTAQPGFPPAAAPWGTGPDLDGRPGGYYVGKRR